MNDRDRSTAATIATTTASRRRSRRPARRGASARARARLGVAAGSGFCSGSWPRATATRSPSAPGPLRPSAPGVTLTLLDPARPSARRSSFSIFIASTTTTPWRRATSSPARDQHAARRGPASAPRPTARPSPCAARIAPRLAAAGRRRPPHGAAAELTSSSPRAAPGANVDLAAVRAASATV